MLSVFGWSCLASANAISMFCATRGGKCEQFGNQSTLDQRANARRHKVSSLGISGVNLDTKCVNHSIKQYTFIIVFYFDFQMTFL